MGRPIHKKFWGANADNNIKVQFFNGTASVPGYIVKQVASRSFKCEDKDGNVRICRLVDKASANLLADEMTITVKFDDGTVKQIIKITSHLVYFTTGPAMPWNFSTSTSDGFVQIEEAGTDTSLTGATDLEGDDVVDGWPQPGDGSPSGSLNVSTSPAGTPYDPGSGVQTISGAVKGLWREWFNGVGYSPIDTTFLNGKRPGSFGKSDEYVSFDTVDLENKSNYMFEWKGYFKASGTAPGTAQYNFWLECDDDMIMWIGTPALSGFNQSNAHIIASNGRHENVNSVTLNREWYYPVRIWFNEYSGAEQALAYWTYCGDGSAHLGNNFLSGTGYDVWWHSTTGTGSNKGFQ